MVNGAKCTKGERRVPVQRLKNYGIKYRKSGPQGLVYLGRANVW